MSNIDWSKAPEDTMAYHPQTGGYVDHWVKWNGKGRNWFCVIGFEEGGWVKAIMPISSNYRDGMVLTPMRTQEEIAADIYESEAEELAKILRGLDGGDKTFIAKTLIDCGYSRK